MLVKAIRHTINLHCGEKKIIVCMMSKIVQQNSAIAYFLFNFQNIQKVL